MRSPTFIEINLPSQLQVNESAFMEYSIKHFSYFFSENLWIQPSLCMWPQIGQERQWKTECPPYRGKLTEKPN